jgi:pimeloyl-ACP methyl ester carboxylesterase
MAFLEHLVDADGFSIRYIEAGQGEPLIVLHGGGGLRHYTSHDLLAEKRRVIVFERPGFGRSAANERSQSMADMASSLAQAVAALGIEKYDVMATSFGTRVALEWALQEPERVQAVVLVSPPRLAMQAPSAPGGNMPLTLYAHPERQQAQEQLSAEDTAKQRSMAMRLMRAERPEPLAQSIEAIRQPVLILHGTSDKMAPPEVGQAYVAAIPDSHLMLVWDAAHEVDADRPEAVVELIEDFLTRHGGFLVNVRSGLVNA